MIPLIYNPRYNITAFGVEKLHPFDGTKFQKIHDYLVKHDLRAQSDFLSPEALSQDQLLKVHTEKYLKSLQHSFQIAKIMEVAPAALLPAWMLDWRVLKPMRLASGGTLLTCREALKHGIAINIGGGYHPMALTCSPLTMYPIRSPACQVAVYGIFSSNIPHAAARQPGMMDRYCQVQI